MSTEVIICDQQTVYALGSGLLIQNHPLFHGHRIIQHINELHPFIVKGLSQLLVVDSSMFDFKQTNAIEQVLALKKTMPVMIVFNEEDDVYLYQLIDRGMSVIVARNVSKEEWLKALEMVRQDKIYFCSTISAKVFALVNHMERIKLMEKVNALKPMDKYILVRICEEASSKQIACELGHSKRTVEGHRTKLMHKFDVKNLAGLVKIAFVTKLYADYLSNPGLYAVTLCAKTSDL
jgi:DNA-binding NarL/FixJ family response regulator